MREAERHRTVLMSKREADALWEEGQTLLRQIEAEAAGDDAHSVV